MKIYSPTGPQLKNSPASRPGDLEVSPWQQLQKSGLQTSAQAPFWEVPASCSKAKGDSKDGIPWPTFPENMPCPLERAEAPGQVNRIFHRKTGSVFQSAIYAIPWGW